MTRYEYNARGEMTRTWGDTVYPVSYSFDDYGRMVSMSTYRNGSGWDGETWPASPGTADTTQWLYDEATGVLTNKLYADGNGTAYTYTSEGRLASRTWARGITTTYSYTNTTGEMVGIDYSDITPDISFTYNRIGQQVAVEDAQGTRTFSYNPATLALTNETMVVPAPGGVGSVTNIIIRSQDNLGRASGLDLALGGTAASLSVSYGYSDLGRFGTVDSVVQSVTNTWQYSYLANSDLIESLVETGAGVTNSRSYEANRNLITEIHNQAQGTTISKYQYQNDALGRRTQRLDTLLPSVQTNLFSYNTRSELTNAVMGAKDFAWAFDNIGNRETYSTNGTTYQYTANSLNQYTQITNGGLKTLTYDLDGNLVTDGTWSNVWNAENRCVLIQPMTPASGCERVELGYDYQGRHYKEIISSFNGSTWNATRTNLWRYDGWLPIQELVLTASGAATNWWAHGLDLSGSMQGAGGIGGFLSWTRSSDTNTFLYSADANGNITELTEAGNPTNVVAAYQWDAYGDPISATGAEATNNVFRWSSKYVIAQTGDKDFGYRILRDHRFMSRDLIGEEGGLNEYAFVWNNSVDALDMLGMFRYWWSGQDPMTFEAVSAFDVGSMWDGWLLGDAGNEDLECFKVRVYGRVEQEMVTISFEFLRGRDWDVCCLCQNQEGILEDPGWIQHVFVTKEGAQQWTYDKKGYPPSNPLTGNFQRTDNTPWYGGDKPLQKIIDKPTEAAGGGYVTHLVCPVSGLVLRSITWVIDRANTSEEKTKLLMNRTKYFLVTADEAPNPFENVEMRPSWGVPPTPTLALSKTD